MIVPAAGQIEAGAEALRHANYTQMEKELKEFAEANIEIPEVVVTSVYGSIYKQGYLLGLYTARQVVQGSTALIEKGIDGRDVL